MSIPDHSFSDPNQIGTWVPPDELDRALNEDFELGPIALNDTSEGLRNQLWHLTVEGNDLTVTPADTGSPVIIITVANVTQCTLAFDQNAHITIAYTALGLPYLYWYDTALGVWTTDLLAAGTLMPSVFLDDKREAQTDANDILMLYTREVSEGVFQLFSREQRDRYGIEYPHTSGVKPYIRKMGMNDGFRVQIGLSYRLV
jgi:hypothetical protein